MTALADLDAVRRGLREGRVSSLELTREALGAAEALQPVLGAFATLTPELALAQADAADRELGAGRDRGPLHGLPVAVKDVIDVAGVPTMLGTPASGHRRPTANAAVVDAAAAAGAVVIGKAATHELAWGMVTPQSRNPFDRSRIVGGSSGGSAAAVAAGLCAAALGTDTNGSVRCPASLCGVAGMKPAYGTLPRAGVAPLAWTQDTVGVLAPTAGDCERALGALTGAPSAGERPGSPRLRVGVDREACADAEPDVERACLEAVEALGVELVEIAAPDRTLAGSGSVIALMAEASSAWGGELDRHPDGFGPEVRAALRAGREVSATAYLAAKRVRALVRRQMTVLFERHRLDALALPTVPVIAAAAGAATVTVRGRRQAIGAAHSRFMAPASLTGQPALSVPCGLDAAGLPIGLQLLGRTGAEAALFALGGAVERLAGSRAVATRRAEIAYNV